MATKRTIPKNHIQQLLTERGIEAQELAAMIGKSKSYLSKLINHTQAVTPVLADQIGRVLGVDPHKVVDLPFQKKFMATCDEGLLGSVLVWIGEAAEKHKIELSHKELSHWASFVYKGAVEEALNFQQTKYLSRAVIEIIRQVKR